MSIQSRITRGIGFGALAVATLGFVTTNDNVIFIPAIGPLIGGGYLTEPIRIKPSGLTQRQKEDESFIILIL